MFGLFFVDNEGDEWICEMKELINCKRKPVVYFWWYQKPKGKDETIRKMNLQLEKTGCVLVFAKAKEQCYLFTVVDFVLNPIEKLNKIRLMWGEKYYLHDWWTLPPDKLKKRIEIEIKEIQEKK